MSRWLGTGAIVLVALTLRLLLFVGYANVDPWDDTLYLALAGQARTGSASGAWTERAEALTSGEVEAPMSFLLRRGAYLPVAFAQSLFGVNELSSALPSLLASLGTLVTIYWMGYRLEDASTGRLAAFYFAVVPLDLVFSTRILADVPQTFWVSLSMAATIEAARGKPQRRARLFWYLVAGLSAYLATFTRLNGLIVVPLMILAAGSELRDRSRRFEPLLSLVVVAGALVLDGLWLKARTGHFWFAFELELAAARAMFEHNPEVVLHPLSFLAVHLSYQEGVLHHFFKLFLGMVRHYDGLRLFSAFAPLGILALLVALVRRRGLVMVCWLAGVFFYVQYGFRFLEWSSETGTLHYFLNAPRLRYLELLLPPLCLLLASLAAELGRRDRRLAWLFTLLLVGPSLYRARENHRFYRSSMEDVRQAAQFLRGEATTLVWTDAWCLEQLELYGSGAIHRLRLLEEDPPIGSLVVLGGSRGAEIPAAAVMETLPLRYRLIHTDPASAPAGWTAVYRHSELVVFRVTP